MIIGRDFVWAHLARAGGEMTHAMFNLFPELVEFADPAHTVAQHTSSRTVRSGSSASSAC